MSIDWKLYSVEVLVRIEFEIESSSKRGCSPERVWNVPHASGKLPPKWRHSFEGTTLTSWQGPNSPEAGKLKHEVGFFDRYADITLLHHIYRGTVQNRTELTSIWAWKGTLFFLNHIDIILFSWTHTEGWSWAFLRWADCSVGGPLFLADLSQRQWPASIAIQLCSVAKPEIENS